MLVLYGGVWGQSREKGPQETEDRRQKTGDRRQETKDKRLDPEPPTENFGDPCLKHAGASRMCISVVN